jgi:hypothetical protein
MTSYNNLVDNIKEVFRDYNIFNGYLENTFRDINITKNTK